MAGVGATTGSDSSGSYAAGGSGGSTAGATATDGAPTNGSGSGAGASTSLGQAATIAPSNGNAAGMTSGGSSNGQTLTGNGLTTGSTSNTGTTSTTSGGPVTGGDSSNGGLQFGSAYGTNSNSGSTTGTTIPSNPTPQDNKIARTTNDLPDPYDPTFATDGKPAQPVDPRYTSVGTLPAPTKVDKNFQQFGSNVYVQNDIAQDYQALREHMLASSDGQAYLSAFENSNVPKVVRFGQTDSMLSVSKASGGLSTPSYQEVSWNPRMAIATETGGMLSPATCGAHEIAHAVRTDSIPANMQGNNALASLQSPAFSNEEEHGVITGPERSIAEANGETPRDTHSSAGAYETDSATSTKPVDPKVQAILDQRLPQLQKLTGQMDDVGITPSMDEAGWLTHADKAAAGLDPWDGDLTTMESNDATLVNNRKLYARDTADMITAASKPFKDASAQQDGAAAKVLQKSSAVQKALNGKGSGWRSFATGDDASGSAGPGAGTGSTNDLTPGRITGVAAGEGAAAETSVLPTLGRVAGRAGEVGGVIGAAAAAGQLGYDAGRTYAAPSGSAEKTQAAQKLGVHAAQTSGGFLGGAAGGAIGGGAAGLAGGPFAEITVPVGALFGGLVGGLAGVWGVNTALNSGGVETT